MQHVEPHAQVAIKQRVLEDALWHLGRLRPGRVLRPIEGEFWAIATGRVFRCATSPRRAACWSASTSAAAATWPTCASARAAVPRQPPAAALRELVGGLSLRERLPQIEVAVGQGGDGGERVVLVLRVLQPPTAEDRARIESFAAQHEVAIWLQPGGPHTAAPINAQQEGELALALPEFGLALPFGPTDFTQVNHRINEVLVRAAVRLLDPQPGERAVDFFCGLGNFTLALARRCGSVLGIEAATSCCAARRRPRGGTGSRRKPASLPANLFEWTATDWEQTRSALGTVDRVLIDPPREGALAWPGCWRARLLVRDASSTCRATLPRWRATAPCWRTRRLDAGRSGGRQHVPAHLARRVDRDARAHRNEPAPTAAAC